MKYLGIFTIIMILSSFPVTQSNTDKFEAETNISVTLLTSDSFVTKWNTSMTSTGSSENNQIRLPLDENGIYNFIVDWGDGTSNTITTWNQTEGKHDYSSTGVYNVVINGNLNGWQFNNSGDRLKIIELSQWGNMSLGNSGSYFYGAENMVLTATDAPNLNGTTSLYQAFTECVNLGATGSMNTWDVAAITNMGRMFMYSSTFNQPLGNWNVSSVTDMSWMFFGASSFNQPLGNWDVSRVTDMSFMLALSTSFNQPLDSWNVSKVITLRAMFNGASSFNQSIENWDVSGVTDMGQIFAYSRSFNQPLGNWNVSGVTNMGDMFASATSFNQSIGGWNVSSVTNMHRMFEKASSFNQPLGNWDVSGVTDLSNMFQNATSFNQPIGNWDVSSADGFFGLDYMFDGASSFNQSLENWDVSRILSMYATFRDATSFNQPLDNWDVSSVSNMYYMLSNTALHYTNYDRLLEAWSQLNLQTWVTLDVGVTRYTNIIARDYIVDTFRWTIRDGGVQESIPPTVSSPQDITYAFGSTGHRIYWYVNDDHPNIYNITLDGLLYANLTSWSNGLINVNIDGLDIGSHTFIINVFDNSGNMATDSVNVIVHESIPPMINNPVDISYTQGSTGNTISWTVGDIHPGVYIVSKDTEVILEDVTWTNGTITINIDGLTEGTYTFTISVYDEFGNVVDDTVMVTVTTIPDTGNDNSGFLNFRLFSFVGLIILISYQRRKR
ncbi:MAG: BspA family leucine-rich repeat surface protein [Candidatus Heimdallarchaeota archaeon]|nr:BspA family leucine-rich repeat surface protein [Candidatus Heimdallarchaeota archaeon]